MQKAESEILLLLDIEHQNMARVLDAFERELTRLSEGEPADTPLLNDIATYFLSFPDECHHPKEDLILDRLLAVAPENRRLLGGLNGEHQEVAAATRNLAELVNRLTAAPEAALPAFIEQGREFLDLYREHMKVERTAFFPEAHRALTEADWLAIDFDLFDRPDPVFSQSAQKSFRLLRDRIIQERASHRPDDD